MVSPLIPIAFSQDKITEFENKIMILKLDILKVGILGRVILNQVILIHKLQYLRYFKQLKILLSM